jgi:hypothetical protein
LELNPKILPFLWNRIQKNSHLFGIEAEKIGSTLFWLTPSKAYTKQGLHQARLTPSKAYTKQGLHQARLTPSNHLP